MNVSLSEDVILLAQGVRVSRYQVPSHVRAFWSANGMEDQLLLRSRPRGLQSLLLIRDFLPPSHRFLPITREAS